MNEDLFQEAMARMGVVPMGKSPKKAMTKEGPETVRIHPQEEGPNDVSEEDRRLFLQALDRLPRNLAEQEDEDPVREDGMVKLKKARVKKDLMPEFLDLHGYTRDEALEQLRAFITQAYLKRLPSVMVVTGKGLHSKQGKGVLKPEVERWIQSKGKRFIRAYAEAPRAFGGSGALVVYLRPD